MQLMAYILVSSSVLSMIMWPMLNTEHSTRFRLVLLCYCKDFYFLMVIGLSSYDVDSWIQDYTIVCMEYCSINTKWALSIITVHKAMVCRKFWGEWNIALAVAFEHCACSISMLCCHLLFTGSHSWFFFFKLWKW